MPLLERKLGALSPALPWRRVGLWASAVGKEKASRWGASETQGTQNGLREAEQKWGWAHEASSRKPSWIAEARLDLSLQWTDPFTLQRST